MRIKDASQNLLASLQEPEFCDVTIEGNTRGEPIQANKLILSIGSQFFRGIFSSANNPVESQNRLVKMSYPNNVLREVIIYLYSGEINCEDMDLLDLKELLSLLKMMDLATELTKVEEFTINKIKEGGFNIKHCLKMVGWYWNANVGESVFEELWTHLGNNFEHLSYYSAITALSDISIIRLLKEKREDRTKTLDRFKTLRVWLYGNSMDIEMKGRVLELFDLDHFTIEELVSDVWMSGLYDANKIIERMEKIYKDREEKFEEELEEREKEIDLLRKERKELLKNQEKQLKAKKIRYTSDFF